jgi:hypothetical protein
MLEYLLHLVVLMVYIGTPMSDNPSSAGNQQGSPSHMRGDPSETTRRASLMKIFKAYLLGAIHDGTYNKHHRTFRFSQASRKWLEHIQYLLRELDHRSWIYREGKTRNVYALETTAAFLDVAFDPLRLESQAERIAYVRGYFDAEGGIPRSSMSRLYIQICQKNQVELEKVKDILEGLEIFCGVVHNPSKEVDPDYWRFFVRARSHTRFMHIISSWHPRKRKIFHQRMKI